MTKGRLVKSLLVLLVLFVLSGAGESSAQDGLTLWKGSFMAMPLPVEVRELIAGAREIKAQAKVE